MNTLQILAVENLDIANHVQKSMYLIGKLPVSQVEKVE